MSEQFWAGPARIVETGRSPETSKRYWEVYCPTCTTHECTLGEGDPRLTQRRDQHNREHSERPLAYPGDPESLRIQGLERKLTEQAAIRTAALEEAAVIAAAGGSYWDMKLVQYRHLFPAEIAAAIRAAKAGTP